MGQCYEEPKLCLDKSIIHRDITVMIVTVRGRGQMMMGAQHCSFPVLGMPERGSSCLRHSCSIDFSVSGRTDRACQDFPHTISCPLLSPRIRNSVASPTHRQIIHHHRHNGSQSRRREVEEAQRHRGRCRPRVHHPLAQESTFSLMKSTDGRILPSIYSSVGRIQELYRGRRWHRTED